MEHKEGPWNLPKVVAKLFLQQPLQDVPSQGMRHIWLGLTSPHTSAGNAMEKDGSWRTTRMLALRPSSKSQALPLSTRKTLFCFGRGDIPFSLELPPRICLSEVSGLGIFFNKLGNYMDYRKRGCCQPAHTFCKQRVKLPDALFINCRL